MNIPREGAALLSFAKASLSPTAAAPVTLSSPPDWTVLAGLARRHRLGPLLHFGLRRSRLAGIPDWLCADWEAQHHDAIAITLYHEPALDEITTAFARGQVAFILLKGEGLSRALYPEAWLRPYDDFDLLIHSESYEAAKAILLDLGFRLRRPGNEAEKRRLFGEIEFDREGARTLTVDLHWDTLMASWEPQSLFNDHDVWRNVDRIHLRGADVPILGREALLLHLCVHLAFHHVFDGLLLLCDLYLLLGRDAGRIDWDRLLALASRCRCRHALHFSLVMVNALMGAEVPSSVLDRLRPSATTRHLMPTGRLPFRDSPAPQMLERYVKFLLIDTGEGRWRALRSWLHSSKPFLRGRVGPFRG